MEVLIILILGIVQGLTEFLPVSSSGHLVLLEHVFQFSPAQALSYTAFLHLGTTLALLYFFKKRIFSINNNLFYYNGHELQKQDVKLVLMIIIATIPAGLVGLFAQTQIEQIFAKPLYSAVFLLVTGLILFFTRFSKEKNIKLNYSSALLIGIAQAVAILPGISRSGTTISIALLLGLSRETSFEFSFLLSVPAIIGANILLFKNMSFNMSAFNMLLSIIVPFLFGLLALYLLKKLVINKKFFYFAYYCWIIGIIAIIFLK
ncbi:MAG: undecaprenyl-diphosphate phosphatase [Ignavibacteria bacterium]|nr:undecaprenyl-diphosphate phosphatase [Ignavibacteria bacterium]